MVHAHLMLPKAGFTPRRGPEPPGQVLRGGAGPTQVRVRVPRSWTTAGLGVPYTLLLRWGPGAQVTRRPTPVPLGAEEKKLRVLVVPAGTEG